MVDWAKCGHAPWEAGGGTAILRATSSTKAVSEESEESEESDGEEESMEVDRLVSDDSDDDAE